MKRLFFALFLMLFSITAVFGALSDPYRRTQQISGFIDDISYLYVSPYAYDSFAENGFVGINLDYNDQANDIRGIIAPAGETINGVFVSTPGLPGIVIGNFTVLSTFIEYLGSQQIETPIAPIVTLTIEHEKLKHVTDTTAQLEYELAVRYSINGGETQTKYCLSTSSEDTEHNKIVINLTDGIGNADIASIQNANIYFRFAEGQVPTAIGQYESRIKFTLVGR